MWKVKDWIAKVHLLEAIYFWFPLSSTETWEMFPQINLQSAPKIWENVFERTNIDGEKKYSASFSYGFIDFVLIHPKLF